MKITNADYVQFHISRQEVIKILTDYIVANHGERIKGKVTSNPMLGADGFNLTFSVQTVVNDDTLNVP